LGGELPFAAQRTPVGDARKRASLQSQALMVVPADMSGLERTSTTGSTCCTAARRSGHSSQLQHLEPGQLSHAGQGAFQNLLSHIERGEIWPLVAATYPLEQIAQA